MEETGVIEETQILDQPGAPGPPMPPAPLEEPPPDRDLWPWLLVLLALAIGGIIVAVVLTRDDNKKATPTTTQAVTTAPAQTVAPLPRTTPKPVVIETAVPKVVGLQTPAALKALQKANLTGTTRGVFSDRPKNEVVAQDPAPTTKVRKGSAVTLNVSKGKKSVPVPDVVGQDSAAAIETVKAQGFAVKVVRVPSDQPAGQVVAQAPPAGKQAPADSAVRLNVSDDSSSTPPATTAPATTAPGTTATPTTTAAATPAPKPKPAQPATVTVPDVRGLKLLAARKKIRQAGLVTEFKGVPSTEPKGTVLGQSPKPGETRKRDDHVFVTVSLGPKSAPPAAGQQPSVPDVTGEDEATAQADLQAAGFKVQVVDRETSDQFEDGIVVAQNPAGGGQAPANSQVTIYVSRYTGG